ncbi:MAG: hypothetical protein KC636_22100 [Myxococcales bacterium]|nr:hypothetical protein [Myxococcales bacterium]
MIAGWTVFGASYFSTLLIGALTADACGAFEADCQEFYYLMIPVAGPILSLASSNTAGLRILYVFPFLVQATGLGLGIAGTVLYVRSGRENTAVNQFGVRLTKRGNLRLNAAPTPSMIGDRVGGGGQLSLHLRF